MSKGDPSLAPGVLAHLFEQEPSLRARMQDKKFPHLTRWLTLPGDKNQLAIGVPSVKAMGMNAKALELMAQWYVPHQSFPKTIPIDVMRREVGRLKIPYMFFLILFGPLRQTNLQYIYYSKFFMYDSSIIPR